MNLRDALMQFTTPEMRQRELAIAREHVARGCGEYYRDCHCTCPDHPCRLLSLPTDDYECATCRDTGTLRLAAPRGERSQLTRDCPDCDLGKMRRSPSLPWDRVEHFDLARLTGKSLARSETVRWLAKGRRAKPWLFMGGSSGTGKTHAAIAAGFALTAEGLRCCFSTVPDLLSRLQSTFHGKGEQTAETILGEARAADVLLFDDLGAESPTEWAAMQVYALLNDRYVHSRLTVITSNLTAAEAPRNRNWSRILGDLSVVVNTTGADRRRSP